MLMPMNTLPAYDMSPTFTEAPPLGANGTMDKISEPAKNNGIGGPGTLVAAKSVPFIRPALAAAMAGLGSSDITLYTALDMPRAGSVRADSSSGCRSFIRCSGSASPMGISKRAGTQLLPPAPPASPELRRLTGMFTRKLWEAEPWDL